MLHLFFLCNTISLNVCSKSKFSFRFTICAILIFSMPDFFMEIEEHNIIPTFSMSFIEYEIIHETTISNYER